MLASKTSELLPIHASQASKIQTKIYRMVLKLEYWDLRGSRMATGICIRLKYITWHPHPSTYKYPSLVVLHKRNKKLRPETMYIVDGRCTPYNRCITWHPHSSLVVRTWGCYRAKPSFEILELGRAERGVPSTRLGSKTREPARLD